MLTEVTDDFIEAAEKDPMLPMSSGGLAADVEEIERIVENVVGPSESVKAATCVEKVFGDSIDCS